MTNYLEELDKRIEAAEERWENNIPRGEALDAAVEAVLDKMLAVKESMNSHAMESQKQAAKEKVEFFEGVIDILNQVKTENG
jgi:hypothetical protein